LGKGASAQVYSEAFLFFCRGDLLAEIKPFSLLQRLSIGRQERPWPSRRFPLATYRKPS
jgi:hypothetical protein